MNSIANTTNSYEADESLLELPGILNPALTEEEMSSYEKQLTEKLAAIDLKLSTLGSDSFIHSFVLSNQRTRAFDQLVTAVGSLKSQAGRKLKNCIDSVKEQNSVNNDGSVPDLRSCTSFANQYLDQAESDQDPKLPLLIQGIVTHIINDFTPLQAYIRALKPVRNAYDLALSNLQELKNSKTLVNNPTVATEVYTPSSPSVALDVNTLITENEAVVPYKKTPCFLISGLDQDPFNAFLVTRIRIKDSATLPFIDELKQHKANTRDCIVTPNWHEAMKQFGKLSPKPTKVLFLQVAHGWMDGAASTNARVDPEEIFTFLKILANKGVKVGLVLDSCFSGTFIENFLIHSVPYKKTNVCLISNSIPKRYSWSSYDIAQNIIDSANLTEVFTKSSSNAFSTGFGLDQLHYTHFLKSSTEQNVPKFSEAKNFVNSMINSALGRNQQNPFALFLRSNQAPPSPSQQYIPRGNNFIDIAEYFRGNYQTSMLLSEGARGKDDGRYLNNATDVYEDALLFHLNQLKAGNTSAYTQDDLDRFSACENFSL